MGLNNKKFKICYLSDLHIDKGLWNKDLFECILYKLKSKPPDIIIVLGDISSKIEFLDDVLKKLSYVCNNIIFVPGNHDIEAEKINGNLVSSSQKYYYLLDFICNKNKVIYLANKYFVLKDLIIVGTMGWFDYSFYTKNDFFIEKGNNLNKNIIWTDKQSLKRLNDIEINNIILFEFKKMLDFIKSKYKTAIYATHYVPFKESLDIYSACNNYHNIAFEGSTEMGNLIINDKLSCNKIVIHGHAHNNIVDKKINNIMIKSKVLGGEEDRIYKKPKLEVDNALGFLYI